MADEPARLPDAIIDHIYGEELDQWYREFFARKGLTDDEREMIEEVVSDIYHQRATIEQFIARVQNVIGDVDRGKTIVIAVLGNDFLKIESYLGINVVEYIRMLGGDPALYVHVADPEEVAGEIIKRDGIVLPADPVVRHRLILAIVSFITDARTRQQTLDVISRGMKVGGVGLSVEEAERLCAAVEARKAELRKAGVVFHEEAAASHIVKPAEGAIIQPEDEAEITRIRQGMPLGDSGMKIQEAIDRVIVRVGAQFKNEEAVKRFRSAIESRLRDVRDHQETFDILTRPTTAGGLGIPPDRTEKVLAIVEEEFTKLHLSSKTIDVRRKTIGPVVTKLTAASRQPQAVVIASAPKAGDVSVRSPDTVGAKEEAIPVKQLKDAVLTTSPGLLRRPDAVGTPRNDSRKESVPAILPSPPPFAVRPMIALPPPPPVAELVHPVPPPSETVDGRRKIIEPVIASEVKPVSRSEAEPRAAAWRSAIPVKQPANVAPKTSPGLPRPSFAKATDGHSATAPHNDKKDVARVMSSLPAPKPPVTAPELVKPKPAAPPPTPQLPVALVPKPTRLSPLPPPPPSPKSPVTPSPPSAISSGRPKLQDVRSVPARLIGPVEELGRLTLEDFRKIAKMPGDAAARALEKIALLQKDSYTKRSEGIRAFRESPLMFLYADIVNTALLGKKSIETVVRERGATDRNSITTEELMALQALNAQLRF